MIKNSFQSFPIPTILLTGFLLVNGCNQVENQEQLPTPQESIESTEFDKVKLCEKFAGEVSAFRNTAKTIVDSRIDFSNAELAQESAQKLLVKTGIKGKVVNSQNETSYYNDDQGMVVDLPVSILLPSGISIKNAIQLNNKNKPVTTFLIKNAWQKLDDEPTLIFDDLKNLRIDSKTKNRIVIAFQDYNVEFCPGISNEK
jgi:hypothetical protein